MREPEWLDGPRFVTWLEGQEEHLENWRVGSTFGRRLTSWRSGAAASVWAVDRILTQLGLHLSLIPEDLWLQESHLRNKEKGRHPRVARELACRLRGEGLTIARISRTVGVSERTVQEWTRNSKPKAVRFVP
jgi:hypothetical protein